MILVRKKVLFILMFYSTLNPSLIEAQNLTTTLQERTTLKLQPTYANNGIGPENSLEGSSILGPREFKVELNARKQPTFEVIGKSKEQLDIFKAATSAGFPINIPFMSQ